MVLNSLLKVVWRFQFFVVVVVVVVIVVVVRGRSFLSGLLRRWIRTRHVKTLRLDGDGDSRGSRSKKTGVAGVHSARAEVESRGSERALSSKIKP